MYNEGEDIANVEEGIYNVNNARNVIRNNDPQI